MTEFVNPPIPIRDCDWAATYDGDEPDDNGHMLIGRGRTEAEAIQNLKDQDEDEADQENEELAAKNP